MDTRQQGPSKKGFEQPEKKTGQEYRSAEKQTGKEYRPNQTRTGQEHMANAQQSGQEFQNPAKKTGQEVQPGCESGKSDQCETPKKTMERDAVKPEIDEEGSAPPDGRGNLSRNVA